MRPGNVLDLNILDLVSRFIENPLVLFNATGVGDKVDEIAAVGYDTVVLDAPLFIGDERENALTEGQVGNVCHGDGLEHLHSVRAADDALQHVRHVEKSADGANVQVALTDAFTSVSDWHQVPREGNHFACMLHMKVVERCFLEGRRVTRGTKCASGSGERAMSDCSDQSMVLSSGDSCRLMAIHCGPRGLRFDRVCFAFG